MLGKIMLKVLGRNSEFRAGPPSAAHHGINAAGVAIILCANYPSFTSSVDFHELMPSCMPKFLSPQEIQSVPS